MPRWIVHLKPYVPAVPKTRVWVPELNCGISPLPSPAAAVFLPVASSHVTLCNVPVSFCHVTVVPTATVRDVGENVLPDVMQKVLVGQFGGGGGGGGVIVESPPLPHEATPIARIRAPNKPRIFIEPPCRPEMRPGWDTAAHRGCDAERFGRDRRHVLKILDRVSFF